MRNVVGELVGPALYDQLRQQALGLLPAAAATALGPAAAAPASAAPAATAVASTPAVPRYHAGRLLECKGLPVPTAAGKEHHMPKIKVTEQHRATGSGQPSIVCIYLVWPLRGGYR